MLENVRYDMSGKVCLITGANAGIGKRAALQLARLGAEVIIVCRNMESGAKAREEIVTTTGNKKVHLFKGDLSRQSSVRSLAETVNNQFSHLDVLIHNAANFDLSMKKPVLTEGGIETIFATNHLGPVLLTYLLLDLLKQGRGRIITIASKGLLAYPGLTIDFDNLNGERKYSPTHAYYQSKLAQLMFTYHAAEVLKPLGVTINCIRVPSVQVDVGRHADVPYLMKQAYKLKRKFALAPETMAETYTYLAASLEVTDVTGQYFDENQAVVKSSKKSYERNTWSRLWEVSNKLTHIEKW